MRINLFWLFLLLAPLTVTLVSCDDDDDDNDVTMMDVLRGDDRFTTLVSALDRTNLDATVEVLENSTLFAPTNQAFEDLGVDLGGVSDSDLSEILLNHVIVGLEIEAADIADGQSYINTALAGIDNQAPGVSLLVEKTSGVKINNTADVTEADLKADNNTVIHVIDAVLLPLDIVGHASANSNFTELVGALQAASGDLVDVLSGEGPFTVFAPLNSAFEEISDIVAGLTPEQLESVLTYHVVAAQVLAGDLTDGQVVTTVNGGTFTVNLGDTVTITDTQGNSATVVLTDVIATNGAIHVLDKVILPQL